jgi:hypothetical protein
MNTQVHSYSHYRDGGGGGDDGGGLRALGGGARMCVISVKKMMLVSSSQQQIQNQYANVWCVGSMFDYEHCVESRDSVWSVVGWMGSLCAC